MVFGQSSTFWEKIQNPLVQLQKKNIPISKRDRVLHSPIHSFEYCREYPKLKTRIFQPPLTLAQCLDQTNIFEILNTQDRCFEFNPSKCGIVDVFKGYPSNAQNLTTNRISASTNHYNVRKNVPIFQEYVICSSEFIIKTGTGVNELEYSKKPTSTSIMIHKLIGVYTKDCIQKIEDNLKSQNEFWVYNKHEVLDFETFQKNKFVLSLSNEESIFEVLEAVKNLPPNAYKEYRTTISFCQFVDKDGRDFCVTLIKDLNADLRGVLWERCIYTIRTASLEDWREQLKFRTRIHLLPNGSFIPNNNNDGETALDVNTPPPVYEN